MNTCSVTNEAERKSGQYVAKLKKLNPSAKIVVTGCAVEREKERFLKKGIDALIGTEDKSRIADIIEGFYNISDGIEASESIDHILHISDRYEEIEFSTTSRSRNYIKIQYGCDRFCSYCIIPYVRGRSRSRAAERILEELKSSHENEIVLIGINLSAYGHDLGGSLTGLIRRIAEVAPRVRLRLGSLETNVIDGEFLTALASLKNFCPHFHLSLQSGDDGVLKDMNRRYDTRTFREKVELIRAFFDNACITTDIIVGFPTESEGGFLNSLRFAESIAFSDIHVFPFSAKKGTKAEALKARVSDLEMKARVTFMTELKRRLKRAYAEKNIGNTLRVLIEESANGHSSGYSENYLRTILSEKIEVGTVVAAHALSVKEDNGEIVVIAKTI
jgi:threonylcarbamoyladenosine tRNA methylthiotransferase MtaB